jgi:hypothetical protein
MKKLLLVSPALVVFSPAAFAALDPPTTPASPPPHPHPAPAAAAADAQSHDSASGGDGSLGIFDRPPEPTSGVLFEQPPLPVKLDEFSHNWFVSRVRRSRIALQPRAIQAASLSLSAS